MKLVRLAALAALRLLPTGCNLAPCCPDTAEEAGIPVRVQHPSSRPQAQSR